MLKHLHGEYYKLLLTRNGSTFLHNDGWLEVNISMDSASIRKRLNNKIEDYRKNNLPNRRLSTVRLIYLKKTVEYLKLHGKVYIVRLPVSPEMFQIEQVLMPSFNEIIYPITKIAHGYLDMTNENQLYKYVDGNHLWKESGKLVSEKIAKWIEMK